MKVLLIINGPAYGSDETFNAVRLAVALSRREGVAVQVFLMGDGLLIEGAPRSTMENLATWTLESDKVLVF